LVFNFALEYTIRRVQINQVGMNLNCTHQLLVYAEYIYVLGGSVNTVKKEEALILASKKIGLEVNADKSKYMVMSGDQSVGRSHYIKININSMARMEEFKYLGTTLTNQNSI
jgi:hypothetical protein